MNSDTEDALIEQPAIARLGKLGWEPPSAYTPELYQTQCSAVYQPVYDHYYGVGKSIYAM